MLLVLKYASWAISVLIPFVGTWFFKFTEDVSGTNRRRLTPSGRVAFAFACAGVAFALALSVISDRQAKHDEVAARVERQGRAVAEQDRDKIQQRLDARTAAMQQQLGEVNKLTDILVRNYSELPPDDQLAFVETANLDLEEIRRSNPEIADAFNEGNLRMVGDFIATQQCDLARQRFNDTESCLVAFGQEDPVVCWRRSNYFALLGGKVYPSIHANDQAATFDVQYSGSISADWNSGLTLSFADGSNADYDCGNEWFSDCRIAFNDRGPGTELYQKLQQTHLRSINFAV